MPDVTAERVLPASAYGSPVLTALRAGTQAAHARTEALPGLLNLMSPALTLGEYSLALAGLLEFHTCLHRTLPPCLARLGVTFTLPDSRLDSLRRDLVWTGSTHTPRRHRRLALGRGVAAIGALYVLEGSALGGRVIGRNLAATLGVAPGQGGDFFCGHDADTARQRWAALCAVLANLPQASGAPALRGARAAFALLEAIFADLATMPARQHAHPSAATAMPAIPAASALISY